MKQLQVSKVKIWQEVTAMRQYSTFGKETGTFSCHFRCHVQSGRWGRRCRGSRARSMSTSRSTRDAVFSRAFAEVARGFAGKLRESHALMFPYRNYLMRLKLSVDDNLIWMTIPYLDLRSINPFHHLSDSVLISWHRQDLQFHLISSHKPISAIRILRRWTR